MKHYLEKELYELVHESPAIFEFLQSGSLDGLWYWDLENPEHEWMNPRFWELLGYDPKDKKHMANEWQHLINPNDLKTAIDNFNQHCADPNHPYDQLVRYKHKNGSTVWVRCRGVAIRNKEGKPIRMLGAHNDLTALKEAEERLNEFALFDHVTGVPNRANFLSILPQAITKAKKHNSILAILFIDLDNFKQTNDHFGHHSGDTLLRKVVQRLSSVLRKEDTLARIGGDEFAVLLESAKDLQEIRHVTQRCLETSANSFLVLGNHIDQYFSIGIAVYPESADTPDMLLQCADTAMYRAKEKGKNNFVFFRKELNQRMQRNNQIELALRTAIKNKELTLLYQPQYNISNKMCGIEALIRWRHPLIENLTPDEFIPIAEKNKQIISIGEWVIEQAIHDWNTLTKQSRQNNLQLSVNISSVQLCHAEFYSKLINIMSNLEFDPQNLTLEITETYLMQNLDEAKQKLLALSEHGIKIALDDFGKGYSSLNYLANLPITHLKIDKDFTLNLGENNNRIIIKSIKSLADSLNMECIAEGVETEKQLQYLKSIHCQKYQGIYFSKPVKISQIT